MLIACHRVVCSGVAVKGLFEEDVGSWSDRVIE